MKFLSVIAALYFCHLIIFFCILAAAGDSPSPYYTPTEITFVACGCLGNISAHGQTWVGDVSSQYSPLGHQQSTISTKPREPPYSASRLSHSQFTYTFNVTPGQKFIRLHFYSTSYSGFNISSAFFSVKANSFTLVNNFSASFAPDDTFFKEFCINVPEDQRSLSITFTPSPDYQDSYAFINGIELVSMPLNLYYTAADDQSLEFVGEGSQFSILNSNALETLYRINVGGSFISPQMDTGMYRTWIADDGYVTDARPSALPVNTTIVLRFSRILNFSAPLAVYRTARTMGLDKNINEHYNLTWEFQVDSGFIYFVRLHFCEFQLEVTEERDRVFKIYLANLTAEDVADVIAWSGGNGVPEYRDYAVAIGSKSDVKKQNLSIALHPAPRWRTKYSDSILNGIEIFKVDNNGSLAGPNPYPTVSQASSFGTRSPQQSTKAKNNRPRMLGIVGVVASGLVVLFIVFLLISRRAVMKEAKSRGPASSLPSDLCTQFSISEIKEATKDFNNLLIIGRGGFGNVYKGFLNGDSIPVAIKRLNPGSQQGALEFQTEIGMLSQLRYLHLVSLIGYCNDDGQMILVYDYMARGTLRDHLYNSDNPPLPWDRRLKICIGAARALHYLHTGASKVIIHRDVKTTNILLDEEWVAKVSDFGLCKFGPNFSKTHVSTQVKGSIGYLDPEYYRLQLLTEKSDVYSFGVVLLEVLCARPPILRTGDKKQVNLAVWATECYRNGKIGDIIDPFLKGNAPPVCLNQFAEVAMRCVNDDRIRRPSMSDVVWGLEFVFQLLRESSEKSEKLGEIEHKTVRYDSASLTRDVFSDIVNPQGR